MARALARVIFVRAKVFVVRCREAQSLACYNHSLGWKNAPDYVCDMGHKMGDAPPAEFSSPVNQDGGHPC
jgi:hypothetical protein